MAAVATLTRAAVVVNKKSVIKPAGLGGAIGAVTIATSDGAPSAWDDGNNARARVARQSTKRRQGVMGGVSGAIVDPTS